MEFWTGLFNPDKIICSDAGCVNKLKWASDGAYLTSWADQTHGITANFGQLCLRYRNDTMDDAGCGVNATNIFAYICEFQCPPGVML